MIEHGCKPDGNAFSPDEATKFLDDMAMQLEAAFDDANVLKARADKK